jgi:hypothetical protein
MYIYKSPDRAVKPAVTQMIAGKMLFITIENGVTSDHAMVTSCITVEAFPKKIGLISTLWEVRNNMRNKEAVIEQKNNKDRN